MFTVSLLPSGPEPVSAIQSGQFLPELNQSFTLISQDEASQSGCMFQKQVAKAAQQTSSPAYDGFGQQVTPNHPD